MPESDNLPCIIALDIGTTAVKFVVFDFALKELSLKETPLKTYRDAPSASEQDATEVWEAVKVGLQDIGKQFKAPKALCFSAAMHSLLAVNEQGEAISKAILWSDLRSKDEAKALRNTDLGMQIYRETGTPIHPMSPLCKLIWWRKNNQVIFENAFKFISIKEYVIYQLTGEFIIDYGMASATGLFAPESLNWHKGALNAAGITPKHLSAIVPPTAKIPLLPEVNYSLHLPQDLTLVPGSSDGCLANLGDGATKAGVYAVSIGTSGAVRTVSENFETDQRMRLFSYMLQYQSFVHGGAVNNGAIALEWLGKNVLGTEEKPMLPIELITMAEKAPIGSDGLLFLPYLQGERAPFWNPDLQAGFVNLNIQHQQQHIARAVMEGVMFNINYVMQTVASIHPPPKLIKASGGFTKSPFWLQMLADISNCTVAVNDGMVSAARGATMLALEALNQQVPENDNSENTQTYLPNTKAHLVYQQNYLTFVEEVEKRI